MPETVETIATLKAGGRVFLPFGEDETFESLNRAIDRIEHQAGETISRAHVITAEGGGVLAWMESYAPNPIDAGLLRSARGR